RSMRTRCINAINSDQTDAVTVGIFEWSAHPDLSIDDREGWAQANPDLGHGRMTERDVSAEREGKEDDEFRTENLCQWVESLDPGKIAPELWDSLADPDSRPAADAPIFCGVDVATEGTHAHIVIAAQRPDGRWHVEVVASRAGYRWVPYWLNARRGTWFSGTVGLQVKGSPSNALAPLLRDSGIDVAEWQGTDMTSSVLGFFTSIQERTVRWLGRDPETPTTPTLLESAAIGVKDRKSGDTFIWDREKSTGDVTPFVAGNIAWWMGNRTTDTFVSAYSDDDWDDIEDSDDESLDDFDDDDLLIV
ncbi:terminase, partial [Corynebacterium sp. AOP40-9SA-29]